MPASGAQTPQKGEISFLFYMVHIILSRTASLENCRNALRVRDFWCRSDSLRFFAGTELAICVMTDAMNASEGNGENEKSKS